MYLFFDTETTGLPKNWSAPLSDFDNWPRLVQLAWILFDKSGNKIVDYNQIIKPHGFTIPKIASNIHGITTEQALREGVLLGDALKIFSKALNKTKTLIAHNINFDEKIIGAELLRENILHNLDDVDKFCTMKSTTNFCQIYGHRGYKWPKLSELHYKLFNYEFEDAHNALADVEACARCFFELKRLNII